ncbi:MAG: pentapeptide repeat-containing protein [Myxococcales bacterium]|nr:pentapeptide repeat-containing protein [Myxococcales bacterium]
MDQPPQLDHPSPDRGGGRLRGLAGLGAALGAEPARGPAERAHRGPERVLPAAGGPGQRPVVGAAAEPTAHHAGGGGLPRGRPLQARGGARGAGAGAGGAGHPGAAGRAAALELHGLDLKRVDLRGADLSGVRLVDSDLRGALLDGARLVDARFTGSDLTGVSLRGAWVDGPDWLSSVAEGRSAVAELSQSEWTVCRSPSGWRVQAAFPGCEGKLVTARPTAAVREGKVKLGPAASDVARVPLDGPPSRLDCSTLGEALTCELIHDGVEYATRLHWGRERLVLEPVGDRWAAVGIEVPAAMYTKLRLDRFNR